MKYKFQSYMDISTSADSLTMIKIHAGGHRMLQRVKHLVGAYKYMKMGSVAVKLLPASTLPVDPLGLSYASDDPQTVDPRDQMNPGLVRITNGESIMDSFSGLTDSVQQQIYLNTMLDPRWSKFMLQSGFQRHATPLFWDLGQIKQDAFPGHIVNVPDSISAAVGSVANVETTIDESGQAAHLAQSTGSSDYGLFQTGHRQRMSWIPTDVLQPLVDDIDTGQRVITPLMMPMPRINVITVLLPKAYKTRYYYRLFITETVYFSGLKNTGIGDGSANEYRAIDNFVRVPMPTPTMPSQLQSLTIPAYYNDGSNGSV